MLIKPVTASDRKQVVQLVWSCRLWQLLFQVLLLGWPIEHGVNAVVQTTDRPNKSFKPNLLRYGNGVAEEACHAAASTTQVGLSSGVMLQGE